MRNLFFIWAVLVCLWAPRAPAAMGGSGGVVISGGGSISVASQAEVNAGTINNKAVTPKTLNNRLGGTNAFLPTAGPLQANMFLQTDGNTNVFTGPNTNALTAAQQATLALAVTNNETGVTLAGATLNGTFGGSINDNTLLGNHITIGDAPYFDINDIYWNNSGNGNLWQWSFNASPPLRLNLNSSPLIDFAASGIQFYEPLSGNGSGLTNLNTVNLQLNGGAFVGSTFTNKSSILGGNLTGANLQNCTNVTGSTLTINNGSVIALNGNLSGAGTAYLTNLANSFAGNGGGLTNLTAAQLTGPLLTSPPTNHIAGWVQIGVTWGGTNLFIPCVYTNQ